MDTLLNGKRPRERPCTHWQNYAEDLTWSRLGIPLAELPLVVADQDIWKSQLKLLHLQLQKGQAGKENYTELIQCFP